MSEQVGLAEEICGNCSHKYRCPECIPNSDQCHCDLDPIQRSFIYSGSVVEARDIIHDDYKCHLDPSRFSPYAPERSLGEGLRGNSKRKGDRGK